MSKRFESKTRKAVLLLIKRFEANRTYYNPDVFEFVMRKLRENKLNAVLMFLREGVL